MISFVDNFAIIYFLNYFDIHDLEIFISRVENYEHQVVNIIHWYFNLGFNSKTCLDLQGYNLFREFVSLRQRFSSKDFPYMVQPTVGLFSFKNFMPVSQHDLYFFLSLIEHSFLSYSSFSNFVTLSFLIYKAHLKGKNWVIDLMLIYCLRFTYLGLQNSVRKHFKFIFLVKELNSKFDLEHFHLWVY